MNWAERRKMAKEPTLALSQFAVDHEQYPERLELDYHVYLYLKEVRDWIFVKLVDAPELGCYLLEGMDHDRKMHCVLPGRPHDAFSMAKFHKVFSSLRDNPNGFLLALMDDDTTVTFFVFKASVFHGRSLEVDKNIPSNRKSPKSKTGPAQPWKRKATDTSQEEKEQKSSAVTPQPSKRKATDTPPEEKEHVEEEAHTGSLKRARPQ